MAIWRKIGNRISSWMRQWMAPAFVGFAGRATIQRGVRFNRNHGKIELGQDVAIFRNSELLAPVAIGDRSFLNRDAYVRPLTVIGRDVAVGPFARFVTDSHEVGPMRKRAGASHFKPIIVEDGVWIGACVTILGGVTIGRGSIIAAGAVVAGDVPENTLFGGVPARFLKALVTESQESSECAQ